MVSLPVEAGRGGRTAAGCCPVPPRASCVQKSAIVSCASSRCSQRLLNTCASLKKKDFWSAIKSPLRCSKPRGGVITTMQTKAAVHCKI